jgi:hypothetical protein
MRLASFKHSGGFFMQVSIQPVKTYATKENAVKAVKAKLHENTLSEVTWFVMRDENNRFFPVFAGERALHFGVHFHFNVVG